MSSRALLLIALIGCPKPGWQTPPKIEYPVWVRHGAGAFPGEAGVVFGVGAIHEMGSHERALEIADERARAEVWRRLEIEVFTATTVPGLEIVDRWTDPGDGTVYALARFDLARFIEAVDQSDLSQQEKELVKRKAEKAHADLPPAQPGS